MLGSINQARQVGGLPPLVASGALNQAAAVLVDDLRAVRDQGRTPAVVPNDAALAAGWTGPIQGQYLAGDTLTLADGALPFLGRTGPNYDSAANAAGVATDDGVWWVLTGNTEQCRQPDGSLAASCEVGADTGDAGLDIARLEAERVIAAHPNADTVRQVLSETCSEMRQPLAACKPEQPESAAGHRAAGLRIVSLRRQGNHSVTVTVLIKQAARGELSVQASADAKEGGQLTSRGRLIATRRRAGGFVQRSYRVRLIPRTRTLYVNFVGRDGWRSRLLQRSVTTP